MISALFLSHRAVLSADTGLLSAALTFLVCSTSEGLCCIRYSAFGASLACGAVDYLWLVS